MDALPLSESLIRQHAGEGSFQRGEEELARGAVTLLVRRGDWLTATVAGGEPAPARVRVALNRSGVVEAACTCPSDHRGWCRHVVAVLLAAVREPAAVEERPPIASRRAPLDRDRLRDLVLELVAADPSLADAVDRRLASSAAPPSRPPAAVDARAVKREVRDALHSLDGLRPSEAYWHVGDAVDGVRAVLGRAWAALAAGDARSALAVLAAVTEEYLAGLEYLDDSDGEASAFFAPLGAAWTEAVLSADLTPDERDGWADELDGWSEQLADYGVDDAFGPALEALVRGWDEPPAGPEASLYAEEVTTARLNVLDRQGRVEDFLRLAEDADLTARRATMLVRVGRVQEAVAEALARLTRADDALAVAQALREHGEAERAPTLGEHGLTLEGAKGGLAVWTRDLAESLGETDRALTAAVAAVQEAPDLDAYLAVRRLAEADWPERREGVLTRLRRSRSFYPAGEVEIFLHEGLTGDAIAAVDGSYADDLVMRVAAAAVATHPDWVVTTARRHAESIMDRAKSTAYDAAVAWLATVRDAYRAAAREQEWRAYRAGLLDQHRRKSKLRPMLEALGA
jgi:uncharacterized Zn finger protein